MDLAAQDVDEVGIFEKQFRRSFAVCAAGFLLKISRGRLGSLLNCRIAKR
jgi:hypothetical protein